MEKIKRAKGISILLLFMMVFQLIMPVNFAYGDADGVNQNIENDEDYSETVSGTAIQAKGIELLQSGNDLGDIFEFEWMKINGKEINNGDIIEIDKDTEVIVRFIWDTKGKNAKGGDIASVQLSDAFADVAIDNQKIEVEGIDVGRYSINGGKLTFVFNDNITLDDVKNGFVELGLKFDLEKFNEDIEQSIPFYDSSNKNIKVIAKPSGSIKGITKEGTTDTKQDAKFITWTIDVVNTDGNTITDAVVKDTLPDGLGNPRNFVVNKLKIGLDGTKSKGDATSINPAGFPINLGTMEPYTGYRITFITDIDYSKVHPDSKYEYSFENNAEFEYGSTSLPATNTVSGLTRSNPIEKNGSVVTGSTDKVNWTIDVNKNGQEIADAKVEDNLPAGHSVVAGTIKYVRIVKNGNGWNEVSPEITVSPNEFPVTLGKLTENDAYRVKFQTQVDWSKVNSGDYSVNNSFTNTAKLLDGTTTLNEASKTVTFTRKPILEKVGVDKVDYTNKTIIWTVTVNSAKHPLGEVTVTDYLPKGLSITGSGIAVTADDNSTVNITSDVDTTNGGLNDGKTKLTINLNNVGTRTITITYTTAIDFDTAGIEFGSFTNSVGMTGNGIGTGGTSRDVEVDIASNTYEKNFKGIDYNQKTMDWELRVNPKRENIASGFVITDTFPNQGMILKRETVSITLGGQELDNTAYTLAPIGSNYNNGFTITFNQPIAGGELVVTYTTSYDPQYTDGDNNSPKPHVGGTDKEKRYINSANFKGKTVHGHDIGVDKEAYTDVIDSSWNSGKKEGKFVHVIDDNGNVADGWISGAERKIAWQIYINYQKQNLGKNVEVKDILPYVGKIDKESIKVSVYTVKADGKTTITDSVLNSSNYNVEVTNKNDTTIGSEFTLKFNNFEVNERYVIEFTTSVPDMSSAQYTNNATVTVEGKNYPYKATLNYAKHNSFLEKNVVGVTGEVFTGDEVNWKVTVNESLSVIYNAEIKDTISEGHVYKKDSLKVYKLQDMQKALVEGKDYTLNTQGNVLTINLLPAAEPLKDTLVLNYTTVVTTEKGDIGNKVEISGSELTTVTKESSKLSARLFSRAGGEWAKSKGALKVTKKDAETDEVIANNSKEATFKLYYDLNGSRVEYKQENPFVTKNGVLEIGDLPFRTYYLKEAESPNGYVLSDDEMTIIVDTAYGDSKVFTLADFENAKEKTIVTATKEWVDGPSIRPTIWFKLYRNISGGAKEEVPGAEIKELSNGTTEAIWKDIDKTNIKGQIYTFSVKEVDSNGDDFKPANYEKAENGLKVTNSYVSPTDASAKAVKVWTGEPEGRTIQKPAIWFKLYRYVEGGTTEEVPGAEIKKLEDGTTEVVWNKLQKTDSNGKEYKFLVKEVNSLGDDFVPKDYSKSEDALTVTNTYTKKDVTAVKVWRGGSSPKPTIWFELYRNVQGGELEKAGVELKELADGTTEVIWQDVDKADKNGNEYIYSVKEVDKDGKDFVPSGYRKSEDGLTVTNTRRPSDPGDPIKVYGKVTVKKIDENKKVLSGAEFTLYDANGKVVAKAVTGSDGTVSFTDLEKGDYVLKETKAPEGYVLDENEKDVAISGSETKTYTITNKKEEPKKPGRLEIIKTDESGKLLSDAWFSLIDENGSTVQNVETVNGRAVFEDVPVGRYTVKEVQAPAGYELSSKEVSVTVESEKTVELSFVNRLKDTPGVPAKGSISIIKIDENSNPLSGAEFTLYDADNRIAATAVSDKDGKVTFDNLKDGRYFVKETKAPEGYVLVNDSKTVDVTGGKTYSYRFKNVPESTLIEEPDVPTGWEIIEEPDVPQGPGTLPNTGYALNTWILAALGLILILAGIILNKRRNFID